MTDDSTHDAVYGATASDASSRDAPGEATASLALADSYRRSGQSRQAVRLLQEILEADPFYGEAFALLANVLMDERRYDEALACWERLTELDPENEEARIGAVRARDRRASRYGSNGGGRYGAAGRATVRWPRAHPLSRPQSEQPPPPTAETAGTVGTVGTVGTATVGVADLLMGLLEYRDPYFRGSSSLARLLAGGIARRLRLEPAATQEIELATVLRDMGQLPLKGMLSQVGSGLTPDARRHVERHVDTALALLEGINLPEPVRLAIRHHHERWEGSGYPDGLSGNDIPIGARIMAVADTFSALIAARPHRLPRSVDSALTEMRDLAGTQFDPDIVAALIGVVASTEWRGPGFGLREHVMVVDPDETRAIIATTRLCSGGFLAEAAFSADGAMARLDRSRVSPLAGLILSADLPGDDLLRLLHLLRQSPRFAFTPVLVTQSDAGRQLALLRSGADACLPEGSSYEEVEATFQAFLRRERRADSRRPRRVLESRVTGLHGNVEDFPLSWLLQVLNYDGRTAAVFITTADDEGSIYLDRGNPRLAQTRSLSGEEAFRAMLGWKAGTFVVDPGAETDRRTISRPLMNLLREEAVVDDRSAYFAAADPSE
ncbi:hypothetical protein BH23GEM9_BH23GEM9_29960 [soil metagenome]